MIIRLFNNTKIKIFSKILFIWKNKKFYIVIISLFKHNNKIMIKIFRKKKRLMTQKK